MNSYPERCLRGLRKDDDVTPEGLVNSIAFHPDFREDKWRSDGGYETSINWEDNDTVVAFMMQRREQSRLGIAALQRTIIEAESGNAPVPNAITYDRRSEPENEYHGNIIYSGAVSRQFIKMIAAVFARRSVLILRSN